MFLLRGILLSCIALAVIAQSNVEEAKPQDLLPTYRTPTERGLQAAAKRFAEGSEGKSTGVMGFISRAFSKSLKTVVPSVEEFTGFSFGDFLNSFQAEFHAIYPGTLWCGAGDIAKDNADVGRIADTDACCRAHDKCSENIKAGQSSGRLLNNGGFTRSACSCDREFYDCLKSSKSKASKNIGITYFTYLRPQCFELEYPLEKCLTKQSTFYRHPKCLSWTLDKTQNKTLQWFDTLDF